MVNTRRGELTAIDVAQFPSAIVAQQRPPAPDHLTDEQRHVWNQTVNGLPADWFRQEALPLLEQYCRHVVHGQRLALLINSLESSEDLDLDSYEKLLRMHEREGRALSSLGTRLRLTPQSTYVPHKSKSKGVGSGVKPPWAAR